jgi:hypothetical protein
LIKLHCRSSVQPPIISVLFNKNKKTEKREPRKHQEHMKKEITFNWKNILYRAAKQKRKKSAVIERVPGDNTITP